MARLMQEAGLQAPGVKGNAGFVTLTFVLPAGVAPRTKGAVRMNPRLAPAPQAEPGGPRGAAENEPVDAPQWVPQPRIGIAELL